MSAYQCFVSSDGSNVSFKTKIESSYLIEYLKSHGTPVSGGEDGTAHNLDGTTYESKVDPDLWGTPLPWYELPTLQGEDEVKHLIEIMAPDAVNAAAKLSTHEIAEAVSPYVKTELEKALGGDY